MHAQLVSHVSCIVSFFPLSLLPSSISFPPLPLFSFLPRFLFFSSCSCHIVCVFFPSSFCLFLSLFLPYLCVCVSLTNSTFSYNMAGHFKFSVTLLGGYFLFSEPVSSNQLLGIACTVSGIVLYTYLKLTEQAQEQRRIANARRPTLSP